MPALRPPAKGRSGSPASRARILVVDDEEPIRKLLRCVLERQRYGVVMAASGEEALDRALESTPDLVILDLMLPATDGLEVCERLRAWLGVPILVLSGRDEQDTKIAALDLGADDYITKPFAVAELLARVRALLRRAVRPFCSPGLVSGGGLRIYMDQRRVFMDDREIHLTRMEFEILVCLAQNPDCVVPSKTLVQNVWGLRYVEDTQTLRVHVGHIRKKIEPDPSLPRYILTEQGIGYRFHVPEQQVALKLGRAVTFAKAGH